MPNRNNEIKRITKREAVEMFVEGFQVYLPNQETPLQEIKDSSEFENIRGFFQITEATYKEYQQCVKIVDRNPDIKSIREAKQYISKEDWYAIYQIDTDSSSRDYRFMNYDFVQRNGYQISREDYGFVYGGKLSPRDTLDSIYERFNINHPADYRGHSLSVSDIVILQQNGVLHSFYVDSFGFRELPDFSLSRDQIKGLDPFIVTSENKKPDKKLEGLSPDEVETRALAHINQIIKDKELDVEVTAVQLYGNRTRDLLYSDNDTIDIVITYDGDLKEDVFSSYLHEKNFMIQGMKVDVSPKNIEDYAGLQAFIDADNQSLDQKEKYVVLEHGSKEWLKEAENLAAELHDFFRDHDPYDYADTVTDPDVEIQRINDLLIGKDIYISEWIHDAMEDCEDEEYETLKALSEKVNDLYLRRDRSVLAKVEEQLEQNYNMIDDLINNEPGKDQAYVEFYVAECQEFHDMGKYIDGLSLPEAIERYKEIREDPRKSYLGNGIGFILHDKDLGIYDETEYPLVNGSRIDGYLLDSVPVFARHPLIRQAVEELREAFPDYRYSPAMEIRESFYPKLMTAEMISVAVADLYVSCEDILHVTYPKLEMKKDNIYYDMLAGKKSQSLSFLNRVMEEVPAEEARAETLKERIKEYQSEMTATMAPFVKITYSEYTDISEKYYPLAEIDQTIQELDKKIFQNQKEDKEVDYQLRYTICYNISGKTETMDGRMNLGDGEGGIVERIQVLTEYKLYNPEWNEYMKKAGEEKYNKIIADLTDIQDHVLPHLQSFVSLPEREPVKTIEAKGKESAVVTKDIPKLEGKEKLSIHEKLKRNKEMLASKTGSEAKEKGVELG